MARGSSQPSSSSGLNTSLISAAVLGALLAVFVMQNTAKVRVKLYFWKFTGPMWLILLGSILIGMVIAQLAGRVGTKK